MLSDKLRAATNSLSPMRLVFNTTLGTKTVNIPLLSGVYTINWGDGIQEFGSSDNPSHTYAADGTYFVYVYGTASTLGGGVYQFSNQLTECRSFGELGISSMSFAFANCTNLVVAPSTLPKSVFNLSSMFINATSFNYDIGSWDVSQVTDMSGMFELASSFNQNIGSWKVGKVENMDGMFLFATAFNQNLSQWCVGNIQSEPLDWATGSSLTSGNKPVWGTCPSYSATGSITYIGEATGITSASLPSHQAGDTILAFAYRDGSRFPPTTPSGWALISTNSTASSSAVLAMKTATSDSETSGTWFNATTVIFLVYRGGLNEFPAYISKSNGSGTTVTYSANGYWKGLSRMVAFAAHRSTDTDLGIAPGSLSLIVNPVDATDEAAAFQSTVNNFGNWESTNVSVGGTPSDWLTFTVRMVPTIAPN